MVKCKNCGGICNSIGGGKYQCDCCGYTFSADEIASVKPVSNRQVQLSGADIYEKNINGILEISCRGQNCAWSGSGYLVSNTGYAITNVHVAANSDGTPCRDINVKVCGVNVPASVVALADNMAGLGSGIDLAIIRLQKLPYGVKRLDLENFDNIRNGECVYVIGNSLGEGTCITRGIVSDKCRTVNGKQMLMTDCAVNGGNSGGPIFNDKGKVIGTITWQGRARDGGDAEGMNYAIPSNVVMDFLYRNRIL